MKHGLKEQPARWGQANPFAEKRVPKRHPFYLEGLLVNSACRWDPSAGRFLFLAHK